MGQCGDVILELWAPNVRPRRVLQCPKSISQSTSLKKYGRYGAVPLRRAEMGRNICSKEGREREVLRRKGVWNAVKKKSTGGVSL